MQTALLKLRSDLVISRQASAEGNMFVIKDPVSDRFFRFKEIEHFIAQQFNGSTPAEIVLRNVEERFGVALSAENLDQFTNRLHRIGLLSDGEIRISAPPRNKIKGDLFYLRFKLFDPDRLFDWVIPRIQFLFTPYFLLSSALLVVCATGVTIIHWSEIIRQFTFLLRFESLLLAWFVMLGVIALHESAHGLTCKYFGGHVREIGFLLIYFQPAFFCNVSDAWLFPEKSKRLWVTFAGAYFEIFLWALATLTWRLTDTSTALNHFALVVTATSAFKMFFNMNPLIKLDGYYLLSDWLGIPNLRQKASGYLGNQIKRVWGAGQHIDVRQREGLILFTYALFSGVYIYWILFKIISWFGGMMVANYQGWGFILSVLTIGFIFRNTLKKIVMPILSIRKSIVRTRIIVPGYIKFCLGTIAGLSILTLFHMEMKVSGPFTVMPLHNADVRAEVEGIIDQIYVGEGDLIEKGAVIARLSDRDYTAELRKTSAEMEAKQAQLKLLKLGPRKEEIELAKTQVAKAEELAKFADGYQLRDKLQYEQKLISIEELEKSQEGAVTRQKELQEARQRLKLLLSGSRPEEIEALEADVRRLEAHKTYLVDQIHSLQVVSPITGVVTTHKLKEKVGENVKKGDLITEVYEMKDVMAEIAVPEKEISEVSIGQKIVLKARAYPGITFEGMVKDIAPVASKPTDWQPDRTILVTTQLDNAAGLLKPEMTGNAKIFCGENRLIDLATHRFVRYFRVEFWSWW